MLSWREAVGCSWLPRLSRQLLERLPLEAPDDFVFDNQILAQVISLGCAIGK
jgi:hypothetical protein